MIASRFSQQSSIVSCWAQALAPSARAVSRSQLVAGNVYLRRPLSTAGASALRPSAAALSAVKPGATEQSTPEGPNHEQITQSDGAYDPSKPSPEQSGSQIEKESGAPMDQTASDSAPSDATRSGETYPGKSQSGQKKPSQENLGGSKARKQQSK